MERKQREHRVAAALTLSIALVASAWSQPVDSPARADAAPAPTSVGSAPPVETSKVTTGPTFAGWFEYAGRGGLPSPPSTSVSGGSIQVLGTEQTTSLPPITGSSTTVSPTTVPPTTFQPTTVAPSSTPATTVPSTAAPATTPEDRGRQALARISYDWVGRLPGWSITFAPGRSGVMGYTYIDEQRIEIFVRNEMSDALVAHVVAHELGHAVDVSLNTGDDRAAWAAARGIESVQWWPGSGVTDFSTGAGDFAEAFAVWQVGAANFRSRAAGVPTADQLALVASLANG